MKITIKQIIIYIGIILLIGIIGIFLYRMVEENNKRFKDQLIKYEFETCRGLK